MMTSTEGLLNLIDKTSIGATHPRRIYLSGPMRGYPDSNKLAFARATADLRAAGHFVYSPGENDDNFEKLGIVINERTVFEADTQYICRHADAIAMMPGWEGSKGARAEKALAEALGLEVVYLD